MSQPQNDMVDCDVLEAAKENVRPLGTGRRVSALSTVLMTPHAQRDAKLAQARNRLRGEVDVALALDEDEDDALEAYCRLVSWTIEHYPQGASAESGLLELLEEATRVLLQHRAAARWTGQVRYLKLWLLYAGMVHRPEDVYRFLVRNEVGTGCALLYEEWAAVLERDGRRKEADEAYKLGIARRAEPLDHLKGRHEEFQKRMMSNPATVAAAAAPRAVLGSRSAVRVGPTTAVANAGLRVFVDPTGTASEAASGNTWTELGTRKMRVKENVGETRKLVGTTVRRTGVKATGTAERIAVFRDAPADEVRGVSEAVALKSVPGSESEMETLRRNPLRNYM